MGAACSDPKAAPGAGADAAADAPGAPGAPGGSASAASLAADPAEAAGLAAGSASAAGLAAGSADAGALAAGSASAAGLAEAAGSAAAVSSAVASSATAGLDDASVAAPAATTASAASLQEGGSAGSTAQADVLAAAPEGGQAAASWDDAVLGADVAPLAARPPNYEALHVRCLRAFEGRTAEAALSDEKARLQGLERERAGKGGGLTLRDPEAVHLDIERASRRIELLEGRVRRFGELGPHCAEMPRQIFGAASDGDAEYVRFLLDARMAPDAQDSRGLTALMHAAINNKVSVAKILLEHRADIGLQDRNGATSLHYAIQFNHVVLLKEMYDAAKGEDHLTVKDRRGKTAIDYARRPDRHDAMHFLTHRLGGRHVLAGKACCAQLQEDISNCCTRVTRGKPQHLPAH